MPTFFRGLAAFFLLCGAISPAAAETFMLRGGGEIEGKLLNAKESPRERYIVSLPSGAEVTLSPDQVVKIAAKSAAEKRYEEYLPRMPDSADGHWRMAEWCRKSDLPDEYRYHLREVLRRDPDHEGARHGLGYSRRDGRWIIPDQFMREQGHVREGRRWRTPQQAALAAQAEKWEAEVLRWNGDIKTWRTSILKRRGNAQDAVAKLRAVRAPAAASKLIELLEDKDEPSELRRLYAETLGNIGTGSAVAALVKAAVEDNSEAVREECLETLGDEQLDDAHRQIALRGFTQALEHANNTFVNRGAEGLARLNHPDATLPLINALRTTHKFMLKSGSGGPGQIGASFGGPGGGGGMGGLSVGGGSKTIQRDIRNQRVLDALTAMHPGLNYGFDQDAWRRWFANERTPDNLNMRRSE